MLGVTLKFPPSQESSDKNDNRNELLGRKTLAETCYLFEQPPSPDGDTFFNDLNVVQLFIERRRSARTASKSDAVILFLPDGTYSHEIKSLIRTCEKSKVPYLTIDHVTDTKDDLVDFMQRFKPEEVYITGAENLTMSIYGFLDAAFDSLVDTFDEIA